MGQVEEGRGTHGSADYAAPKSHPPDGTRDVQGPLVPAFKKRRDLLKRLAPDFGSWMHEGPSEARWPAAPKRYAVSIMGHGWHAEDWWSLADDEAELRELLADEESTVCQIIDLDTGEDVPFEREIVVSVSLQEPLDLDGKEVTQ